MRIEDLRVRERNESRDSFSERSATIEELRSILEAEGYVVIGSVDYDAAYQAKHATVRQRIDIAIGKGKPPRTGGLVDQHGYRLANLNDTP